MKKKIIIFNRNKVMKKFAFKKLISEYLFMLDNLNKDFFVEIYKDLMELLAFLRVFFYWVKLEFSFPRESSNPENDNQYKSKCKNRELNRHKGAFKGSLFPRYVPVRSTRIERIGIGLRRLYKCSPIGC